MNSVWTVADRTKLATALVALATVITLLVTSSAVDAGGPLRARDALAGELGIDVSEVTIVRIEFVEWTDGCLGLAALGEACGGRLSEIPEGNVTWLVVGDVGYRYHGSERYRALRFAAGPFPADQVTNAPLPEGARLRPIDSDDRVELAKVGGLPNTGSGGLADAGGGGVAAWVWASVGAAMVVVAGGGWRRIAR